MVKRVHEFQRRISGGASPSGSGRRGEDTQLALEPKKLKKKKKKRRSQDDVGGSPAKTGKPASKGAGTGGAGKGEDYVKALWDLSKKDGQAVKDKGMGACLSFLRTGECGFGAKCKFPHNKRFWDIQRRVFNPARAQPSSGEQGLHFSEVWLDEVAGANFIQGRAVRLRVQTSPTGLLRG